MRVAEDRAVFGFFASLGPESLDAVEVSGGGTPHPWKSFTRLAYPDFDLLDPDHAERYDVVICRHVLEHVADPWVAMRSLRDLARPGGYVVVTTPFMVKIHRDPRDLWRFTPDGITTLMETVGLDVVEVGGWGNAWAVAMNARIWIADRPVLRRFLMHNNPATPLVVWGIGRRDDG